MSFCEQKEKGLDVGKMNGTKDVITRKTTGERQCSKA
jgi:hypothetical protein